MSSQALLKKAPMEHHVNGSDQPLHPKTGMPASVAPGVSPVLEKVSPQDFDRQMEGFLDILPEQTGQFHLAWWGEGTMECQILRRGGEVIAGASLVTKKVPGLKAGIAIAKWGPAWRRPETDVDPEIARTFIRHLQNHYCHDRGFHLTIMPAALPEHDETMSQLLMEEGFSEGAGLPAPERYLVNTDQPSADMVASLDQKWRYNLRKAKKNDFHIEFYDGDEGVDAFQLLYDQMQERKQFHDSSAIDCLGSLMQTTVKSFIPRVVLVSHEGRVTAGGVFFISGEMATYMFGATDDRALRLKAGYAMHGWIAEHLCADPAIKWYDLGGNDLDKGLRQFKKGFVGKTGRIVMAPPRYHYAASLKSRLIGDAIFKARDLKAGIERRLHDMRVAKDR